jgi:hypothetical protein
LKSRISRAAFINSSIGNHSSESSSVAALLVYDPSQAYKAPLRVVSLTRLLNLLYAIN